MKNRFFELEKEAKGAFKYVRDTLNKNRQIDIDDDGDPLVLDFRELRDDLIRVYISRDGKKESFTINPRGRKILTKSFDEDDGFERAEKKKEKIEAKPKSKNKEKSKKNSEREVKLNDSEDYKSFIKTLMKDD